MEENRRKADILDGISDTISNTIYENISDDDFFRLVRMFCFSIDVADEEILEIINNPISETFDEFINIKKSLE